VIVRRAIPADVPAILRLIVALAVYEREPDAVKATEASLTQSLFGEDVHVHAHVVELDGEVVGIAVWFLNYSTWTGRPGIYLEDLFVADAARGTGAGRALLKALAREAQARGCARIDWAVLNWNTPAMDFYRTLGARQQTGWQPWRIDGAALEELAR
jgi:GNAT superfamily N-acetyltransferase